LHFFKARLTLLLLSVGLSCDRSDSSLNQPVELLTYVKLFEAEASARGIGVDVSSRALSIAFGHVLHAGSCKPNALPKIVTIDSSTWTYLTENDKELLVFHELAHCLLGREHANEKLLSGECKSWMRDGPSSCKVNLTNKRWRAYYLDELFGVAPNYPLWYTRANPFRTIFEPFKSFDGLPKESLMDSITTEIKGDWRINVAFDNTSATGSFAMMLNEYVMEYLYVPGEDSMRRVVMLNQYQQAKNNIISMELEPLRKDESVDVIKSGDVLLVFANDQIRIAYPIESNDIKVLFFSYSKKKLRTSLYKLEQPTDSIKTNL
jgi:hypothetical protein